MSSEGLAGLRTIAQIAKAERVPVYKIRYIVATRDIACTTRVGHVYLYNGDQVRQIRSALRRIASNTGARHQTLPCSDGVHQMLPEGGRLQL